jgi:hypothetical protein
MTFSTPDVALDFTVSEPVSLIKYSIDGQGNVTVYGNTTLAGLSSGNHSVTVYVWDRAGHAGASDITHFTMYEPEPAFFPTTLAIATIALVVVIGVGLLVYFKKRNNNHNLLHHVVNDGAS